MILQGFCLVLKGLAERTAGRARKACQRQKGTCMFRKSALVLAMAGTFAGGNAAALGLGDIELKSALNQPLVAEIELLSATPAEMEELKVSLAAPDAFAKAGIDRPLFLTKFRFDVTRNAQGKPVLMVTSRKPVREPFLDFMLELSWSKGRLLREYTVLIDPPVTMPAAAPAVAQAPAATAAPAAAAPRAAAPAPASAPAVYSRAPVSAAPGEYGPTKRNDTLWRIAEQVRPDSGVSIEQTMLGLLRANPQAFYGNNINNLKAGYILRIPSREEMTSVGRAEALREARAQYAAWKAARSNSTQAAAAAPATKLQLVAPELGEASSGTVGQGADETASLEALKRELVLANEAMEAQRRESEDMSQRLSMLEEQIANMQRLIQLKDDELARLQAMAGEQPLDAAAADDAAATPTAEAAVTEAGEGADVAGAGPDQAAAEPSAGAEGVEAADAAGTPEAGMSTADPLAAADQPAVADQPATVDQPVATDQPLDTEAPADTGESAAPPVDEVPVPAVVTTEAAETGFVDRLLANPMYLGAGAGVLALLAFFGLRRRRGVETEFQESILRASADDEADGEQAAFTEPQSQDQASSESSLLSEFAVSDMGSIKNEGEADPLSEADVYLAYGRYQQAEELIREALEKEPEREDVNLKLLEVFLATQNQGAFDEHAQTILARLENTADPMWTKVAAMGRELSPDNPLYQDDTQGAETAAADDSLDFDIEEVSRSLDEAASLDTETPEAPAADAGEGLEFDMDLGDDGQATDGAASQPDAGAAERQEDTSTTATASADDGLDFDIESFGDLGDAEPAEATQDGELAELDEVSTKLDLARAYIDMGDPDGARSILDEVLEEGSDAQKNEAQDIMAKIA